MTFTIIELSLPVEELKQDDILQGANGKELVMQNDAKAIDEDSDLIALFFTSGWNAFKRGTMVNIIRPVPSNGSIDNISETLHNKIVAEFYNGSPTTTRLRSDWQDFIEDNNYDESDDYQDILSILAWYS